MKRLLLFILPFFLVACAARPVVARQTTSKATSGPSKLSGIPAQAETITSGYPANDASITAVMASKSAPATGMTATMTAQPSETPLPAVPEDAPFCQPVDLQRFFTSNGATQSILLSAGLRNTGSEACFLQAWPQVRLEDRQGKALEVDYGYFDIGFSAPGAAATQRAKDYATAKAGLWPGWSVWINLLWQNWCGAPVSGGAVIRLTFNNSGVISIPTDVAGGGTCNAQGQRSHVGITKLVLIPAP